MKHNLLPKISSQETSLWPTPDQGSADGFEYGSVSQPRESTHLAPSGEVNDPLADVGMAPVGETLAAYLDAATARSYIGAKVRIAPKGEMPILKLGYDPVKGEQPHDLTDPAVIEQVREQYRHSAIEKASKNPWWHKMRRSAGGTADERGVEIIAKHEMRVEVDGRATYQGYEIFELDRKATAEELKSVKNTVDLIDQFSGGALTTDRYASRIILGRNIDRGDMDHGVTESNKYAAGFKSSEGIYVNLDELRRRAELLGIRSEEIIPIVLVHEMLGHDVESYLEGRTGLRFMKHYDYSNERKAGVSIRSVHEQITPKNNDYVDYGPAREYGAVNSAEDLATSVEATLVDPMGWEAAKSVLHEGRFVQDEQRRDIIIDMLDEAAKKAASNRSNPGYVGSPISVVTDVDGRPIWTERRRKVVEGSTMTGKEAVSAEIEKMADQIADVPEIPVRIYDVINL